MITCQANSDGLCINVQYYTVLLLLLLLFVVVLLLLELGGVCMVL